MRTYKTEQFYENNPTLAEALGILERAGLLTDPIVKACFDYAYPQWNHYRETENLKAAFNQLLHAEKLTEEWVKVCLTVPQYVRELASAIKVLVEE